MKDQYRQGVIVVAILIVLMALGVASGELAKRNGSDRLPNSTNTTAPVTQTIKYEGQDGKSVLDLLKETHTVETTDSSLGTFVRSIDGIAQTENSYWFFYVDGQPADNAADKIQTKNGQSIEWRYETIETL